MTVIESIRRRHIVAFAVWVVFAAALNLHFADLGETYVTRNLAAWIVIPVLTATLWWLPLRRADVRLNKPVALALLALPVGAVLVVALNILGPFDGLHPGHYFMPPMLLTFALLALGLMNAELTADDWSLGLAAIMLAFLPQYVLHFLVTNPLVFFDYNFSLPRLFYKPSAGFGQYNLYGSFLASLILLAVWAVSTLPMPKLRRVLLFGLIGVYALDIGNMSSKTGLLGLVAGAFFMGSHVFSISKKKAVKENFLTAVGIIAVAFVATSLAVAEEARTATTLDTWKGDAVSIQTRLAMWIIAWRSFLEAPLFGHGLGSFQLTYIEHFARYGVEEGLMFYPVVGIPHNLVMHVISETGLVGLMLLLGPLFFIVGYILKMSQQRLLVLALVTPVALHCLTEYPYIASGMHYMMLALGLAAGLFGGLKTEPIKPVIALSDKKRLALYGGVCLLCVGVAAGAANMGHLVVRATQNYTRDLPLPLEAFIETRYQRPELYHPIIGRRLLAMTDIHMVNLIMNDNRRDLLIERGIPSLEKNVLPYYASSGAWEISLVAYGVAGEKDKFLNLLRHVARMHPPTAAKFRQRYIRQTPPK